MRLQVDGVLDDRRRASGGRRMVSALLAVALHAVLALLFAVVPRMSASERQPIEYVPVTLVPPPRLGVEEAAAPQRQEVVPESEPEEPEPPPEPEPEPESEAPVLAESSQEESPEEPEPEPPPADPEPQPRTTDERSEATGESVSDRVGPPAGSRDGSPTSDLEHTAAVAAFDNPDFTYGYYVDRMLALIRAHWVRPPLGSGVEVMVHFRIASDGEVSDIDIRRSSGYSSFDLAALRAVRSASPLPPLPRSYDEESLGVNLIFR